MENELMENEKIINTFIIDNVIFDLIEKPETIYAGKMVYDSEGKKYDSKGNPVKLKKIDLKSLPIKERITNPEIAIILNINYWKKTNEQLCLMPAYEVSTGEQAEDVDVFIMPASQYVRVFLDEKAAKLLGKENCHHHELFFLIEDIFMPRYGYKHATNGAQDIETHDFRNHHCYAYVAVERY